MQTATVSYNNDTDITSFTDDNGKVLATVQPTGDTDGDTGVYAMHYGDTTARGEFGDMMDQAEEHLEANGYLVDTTE